MCQIFKIPDYCCPFFHTDVFINILERKYCMYARIMNKDVHMSIRVSNKSNSLNLFDKLLARCDSNQR